MKKRRVGSGRPDRQKRERGGNERETMKPAPTERNNSSPNFKAEVSESTSGSRRFNTPLRLTAETAQTGTWRHYESHRYKASTLFLFFFCLFFQSFSPFHSHTASPPISCSHYELYTVCCSAAVGAPFPHRWLFWGAGKLEATVLIIFFFLSKRLWGQKFGENYTRQPNRSPLSKGLTDAFIRAQHLWIMYGGGRGLRCNRSRQKGRGEEEKETHTSTHKRWKLTHIHTHAPPLKANATESRITAESIRTNLREMKWSKSKMKRRDEME